MIKHTHKFQGTLSTFSVTLKKFKNIEMTATTIPVTATKL